MKTRFAALFSLCLAASIPFILSGCSTTTPQNSASDDTAPDTKTAKTTDKSDTGKTDEKPGVEHFANNKNGLQGALKENYVEFSFDFPDSWDYKPESQDPDSRNFVKVERSLKDKDKGTFTLENFAAGSLKLKTPQARSPKKLAELAGVYSKQLKAKWPNYREVSQGPTKVGSYSAYEIRFESTALKTKRGKVTLWGRIILLPHPKTQNGLTLFMTSSSLEGKIKSAADVGVKGELPVILKSFKFI